MLTVEEITSEGSFKDICSLWEGLLKKTGSHSLFLSHDWFLCCLSSFSKGKDVSILIIRREDSVVGIAPLWSYSDTVRGINVRKYEFITSHDTPFVDFIVHDANRKEVLEAILSHFYNRSSCNWDILNLCQWPVESENYCSLLDILNAQGRLFSSGVSSVVPYIPIMGDWQTFFKTKSAKFRGTRNNIANRIKKLKNVEIRCVRSDPDGQNLKDVIEVSKKGWKHNEGISIASQEGTDEFFVNLTNLAGKRGWLMIWLLYVDGIPVAMEYDLDCEKNVYALRADFDESLKKSSPGTYLEYQIIKHLFDKGYCNYNTGPGLNEYKSHWTNQAKENLVVSIYNDNTKSFIIWAIECKILPFLRSLRDLLCKVKPKKTNRY